MLEAAEVGRKVSKEEYAERVPQLRVDLINAQYDLRNADFPVLLVIVGDDRVGCNDLLNTLNEWMDARFIATQFFGEPTEEERQRPRMWRYWLATPGKGELAIFAGHWLLHTLTERTKGEIDDAELERRVRHMSRLEQNLVDDGALVLKFWLHVPRAALEKRIKKSKSRKREKNDRNHEHVDEVDRELLKSYDEVIPLVELALRQSSERVPWEVVESSRARHRNLAVAERILSALSARLDRPARPAPAASAEPASVVDASQTVLANVDLDASLPYDTYKEELDLLQVRLRGLTLQAREHGVSSVLLFEGWDGAGKGGVIRRLTRDLDVQDYRIVPISVPTDEERAHHYLWRFWRQLPRAGRMLIFDRSWYGRVLVERVEALAREDEWRRAYAEINGLEELIVQQGMLLQKFWLHIDKDEQLERFRAREKTPYKKYKITEDDYRNRARWDDYAAAVQDMVSRTSTDLAPWHLVPANDKRWARVSVLRTVCDGLEKLLDETKG